MQILLIMKTITIFDVSIDLIKWITIQLSFQKEKQGGGGAKVVPISIYVYLPLEYLVYKSEHR